MTKKKPMQEETYRDRLRKLKLRVGSYSNAIKIEQKKIQAIKLKIDDLDKRRNDVFYQIGCLEIEFKDGWKLIVEKTNETETDRK